VPLDALPDESDEGGECLGDHVAIDVRPVLWDLGRSHAPITDKAVLLALGGIDYDASMPRSADATQRTTMNDSAPRSETAPMRFEPLPETAREVEAIAALFREARPSGDGAETLEGAKATKEELVARAPRARYLHLSTHGFFAPANSALTREDMLFGSGTASDLFSFDHEVRGFAPLTLCGLALAGANERADAPTTGRAVITAEEIGALDLSRCELGVLSACDTNVGERSAGQGIASFQKALHAAGARTAITSLWRVPDQAARELMVAFYRNLWIAKMPKAEALWNAKRSLRAERAPLRDWAAWVLSGEPD
jgi:CHAT domain-containing protein